METPGPAGVMETLNKEVNNNQQETKEAVTEAAHSGGAEARAITVCDPEEWLCVAKLPLDTDQEAFTELLSEFGAVKESFLLASSKTGVFKGYGFACFHTKVSALQARHVLDGQTVGGHTVDCGWLKEGSHSLAELHSKVLYVDKLPAGFRDLAQFRKLFSTIVNPPYCQIAQKHGVLQDWGLVEYNSAEEAEATMETLRGARLDTEEVRVQYCIPNIHAINIYMNFVNNPMERVEKKALMDETPSKDVYQQLECLAKQNPWFVQSLRSIMTQNILAEDHPAPAPAPAHTEPGPGADPSSHHAVLALLLAAYLKPSQGSAAASQLTGLIKQLEAGTSAVELLKHALVPGLAAAPPPDSGRGTGALLPSPGGGGDLATLISSMTSLVSQGKLASQPPTSAVTPNTKNPQLMNMLYSAFQARMSKLQHHNAEPEKAGSPPSPSQVSPTPAPAETSDPPAPAPVAAPPPGGGCGEGVLGPAPCYMYQPHYPAPAPGQVPAMPQYLSLPPPPPPPGPAAADPSWQLMGGGGLLYSPVMTPPLWPPHPPHPLFHPPGPPQHAAYKRKPEELLAPHPAAAYPEAEGQVKRQKLGT